MDPQTQPHDLDAERAVLGSMMLSPDAVKAVEPVLRPRDFYDQRHGLVFAAIKDLRKRDAPVDAIQVKAVMQSSGEITRLGGPAFLFALIQASPMPASAAHYAGIVRDRAILREVITAAARVTQMAYQPGEPADSLAEQAAEIMAKIRDHGVVDDLSETLSLGEFVAQELDDDDWVIPGLLTRDDRLLLTGGEGLGKSTLCRQMAVCAAAGVHPFTGKPTESQKVLVVDCENPKRLSLEAYSGLRAKARHLGHDAVDDRLFIRLRPGGLDLNDADDVRWLVHHVEVFAPDLLVIGPLYKLQANNPNDEEIARGVSLALDKARLLNRGCALVAEAHASKDRRQLTPIGSSLWLRWPEFGIGLSGPDDAQKDHNGRPDLVDLVHWRGPRVEREWPRRLRQGGEWPWSLPYEDRFQQAVMSPQDRAAGEREEAWAGGGQL